MIPSDKLTDQQLVAVTRRWVESLVVGYNLCPFARRELVNDRLRFSVCRAREEEELLEFMEQELLLLDRTAGIETTLIIHPHVLEDFYRYNQFLAYGENLLAASGREGVYQIASFHPGYQFAGTAPDDAENYSNRSPYPMLHLLREESLERAIAEHPGVEQIPQRNIELMNGLGTDRLRLLLLACHED